MFNYMSYNYIFDGVASMSPLPDRAVSQRKGSVGSETRRDASSLRLMNVKPLREITLPTGNPDERDGLTGMDGLLPLSVACHSGWVPTLQLFIHLRERN